MRDLEVLKAGGYCAYSNKYRMAIRIDRPDWKEHMAERHSPWNVDDGRAWVDGLGWMSADHYRHCYSQDVLIDLPKELWLALRRLNNVAGGHGLVQSYIAMTEPLPPSLERLRWSARRAA